MIVVYSEIGLPSPGLKMSGDLDMDPGEGRAWGMEESHWGIMT